jgi:hypothetical protein
MNVVEILYLFRHLSKPGNFNREYATLKKREWMLSMSGSANMSNVMTYGDPGFPLLTCPIASVCLAPHF